MILAIFYGLIVFVGFYLIIKCTIHRKKGVHLDAKLDGFQDERGTQYPVFKFTYEDGGCDYGDYQLEYYKGDYKPYTQTHEHICLIFDLVCIHLKRF